MVDLVAFGVLSRAELERRGHGARSRTRELAAGRLRRVRPGLFVTMPPPDGPLDRWRQRCALAIADAGPDAALARQAAATLWGLDGFEPPTPIAVNVTRRSGRRRANVHRPRRPIGDTTEIGGLPVTSAAQTLLELGADLPPRRALASGTGSWLSTADQVELAAECAMRRCLVTEVELLRIVASSPLPTAGRAVLDEILRRRPPGAPPTESYLETRCVQVLRNAGLPTGDRQVRILDDFGRFVGRVDLMLAPRVIVEADGREHHGPDRYAADRRRWTELSALGYHVAVFTWEDVELSPGFVVAKARDLLARYAHER